MFTRLRRNMPIVLFAILGLLLPTQLGKHFWPAFSFVNGIRVDYFSPTLYTTDILLLLLVVAVWKRIWQQVQKHTKMLLIAFLILGISWTLRGFEPLFVYRALQYGKILCVALIFRCATEHEKRTFLIGLGISTIYMTALSFFQLYYKESLQGVWWWLGERMYTGATPGISSISAQGLKIVRPYGTFSHPNTMGGFYLVSLSVFFLGGLYWAVIPAATLVLLSFSRIATVGFASFMLFTAFRIDCVRCKYVKIALFVLLAAVALVWKGSETSVAERLYTWSYGVDHLLKTLLQPPMLGDYLIPRTSLPFSGLFNQPIHNALLIFMSEWKIAGALLLFVIVRHILPVVPRITLIFLVTIALFDHYLLTQQQGLLLLGVITGWRVPAKTSEKTTRS